MIYRLTILLLSKKTTSENKKEVRPGVFYVDKQVKKTLIPFENIDGLLLNEVKQVLGIKTITIACTVNTGTKQSITFLIMN